jgi:hypothetical protein
MGPESLIQKIPGVLERGDIHLYKNSKPFSIRKFDLNHIIGFAFTVTKLA